MPYRAAISSLFMHLAYNELMKLEGVIPYRYVLDYENDRLEALEPDAPTLRDLDIVLVSLPYELDYPYAVKALHYGGIDVARGTRTKPVVIGGGIAAYSNPAPLARILDAVAIGDAEGILEELPYVVRDRGLEGLCDLEHVLVYELCSDRVPKNVAKLSDVPTSIAFQVHSLEEEPIYGHGLRVEVSRGCPRYCAFCLEGHVTKPFRYLPLEKTLRAIELGLSKCPFKRVILYSLSLLDVPYAIELLKELRDMDIEASVPSLRPDYVDENVVELVKEIGQKTLTIAPESLDPEIACRIGKCYAIDELVKVVERASSLGMNVKLYLIAGLPGENEELFAKNVSKFLELLSPRARRSLRLSINPLIPKPWTPTQFLSHSYPYEVAKGLRKALRSVRVEVDVMDWRWGVIQAFIALGDESVSSYIVEWGLKGIKPSIAKTLLNKRLGKRTWEEMVDLGIPRNYLRMRFDFLSSFDSRWATEGAS